MSTQNINQNSPEMKTTREKAPYAYRITPAQMRLILWLQIFGILIIYGIILLPFTAFYYLGWATHNKNPDQSFFAFLINKKEDGKKELIEKTVQGTLKIVKQTVTLTKKIFAFLIGLLTFSLSYSGTKALFTLFMMSIFESVNERVFRNIDGIGSILGLIGGIVVANYVYKGILNGKQTGSLWRRSLTAILIIIILIIGSIVYLAKELRYLADF